MLRSYAKIIIFSYVRPKVPHKIENLKGYEAGNG